MTMPSETSPILIVGAGPTGLCLAIALRLKGIDAHLVDRQPQGANTSRAAVIHARTLEVLEELGATPMLLARGIRVPRFRVRERDRVLMDIDFGTLPGRYPFTLMLPQDETEAVLRERLRQLGGVVHWSTELQRLEQRAEHVVAHLRDPAGASELKARWVVGCDGFHSTVREAVGIPFAGGMYAESFVLADVSMDWPLTRAEVDLFLSPAGLMVVAPLPGDRYRIVATADDAPAQPDATFVQALLDDRGPRRQAARIVDVAWSSRFRVHHRQAAGIVAGNVILCGDAAHVHSPAGGQGMNMGIQDAASLVAPLLHAQAGDRASMLAWAHRREAVARSVVRMTDRMTRAATLRSPLARAARNATLSAVGTIPHARRAMARRIAGLD